MSVRSLSSFYSDLAKSFIDEGEAILVSAKAERARIPIYEARRTPVGDSMRWAMNLVDIDLACIERLLSEMKTAKHLGVIEKLLEEMRKEQLRMPRDVDNALGVLKTLKAEKVPAVVVTATSTEGVCALPGCFKTPRENSIYCDDRHRVDMARLKAKQRAQASKAQAAK